MNTKYREQPEFGQEAVALGTLADLFPTRKNNIPHKNLHIKFPNGVTLSLAWGWGAYCSPTTVEVGIWDREGTWITNEVYSSFHSDELGDDVQGWVDAWGVKEYYIACQNWR